MKLSGKGSCHILVVAIIVVLLFGCFTNSYAETRYSKTDTVKVNLQIVNGVAKCVGMARALSDYPCYLMVRLYKLQSGSWQQIRMWSAYEVDGEATVVGNCTLTDSGRYKAVATSTVEDEVASVTSSICDY